MIEILEHLVFNVKMALEKRQDWFKKKKETYSKTLWNYEEKLKNTYLSLLQKRLDQVKESKLMVGIWNWS